MVTVPQKWYLRWRAIWCAVLRRKPTVYVQGPGDIAQIFGNSVELNSLQFGVNRVLHWLMRYNDVESWRVVCPDLRIDISFIRDDRREED